MTMIGLAILTILLLKDTCGASVTPDPVFQYIDANQEKFVQRLKEWVVIKSDSSDPSLRNEVHKMMEITAELIKTLGGTAELVDIGLQQLPSGETLKLPSVVLGQIGQDPDKPTLCIYGHTDVQPARKEDGWDTDPYTLTEINGNLYGRGASDDKGQILPWINAAEALQSQELPVNFKFLIEGMEEVGSDGLAELIMKRNQTFFSDVDYIVLADTAWISEKPALTYGARGNCYFLVEVECANRDLHSGSYGGVIHEAMTDLIALLDSLTNSSGHILIPGINEAVAALTDEETKLYSGISFDHEEFRNKIGAQELRQKNKEDVLLQRWRYPSLTIHGIEGAFSGAGTKTVIPAKVIGKFSIRQVPDMDPLQVEKQVIEYLDKKFAELKSPNKMKTTMVIGAKPWLTDPNNKAFHAGRKASKRAFGVEPDLIRVGGTIPIATTLEDVTGKNLIMMPLGGPYDAAHGQNEKISRYNYIEGTKFAAAYAQEFAKL
ncbi:cytosolic non-specific dipeptidase-like isoform X2 [Protopterus annectens]|uniref:cytosolic non-specific dipeptidase-like isoform X2 n=1 Tax=Protopterus annectens TaxID=7888 RepID=UPI001CFBDD9C|nr:cytosolic non-specific dipeptidase-like isoform X2 [Protopterus annectens]